MVTALCAFLPLLSEAGRVRVIILMFMATFTASQLLNRVELGRTGQSEESHAAQARFILGTELLNLTGHLSAILQILAALFALLEILL